MIRSLFQMSWRVLLAVSLAVGPWPPAAWAALGSKTADVEAMSDCHDTDSPAYTSAPDATPCEDGCCPDPACDPAHCLILHASIAAVSTTLMSVEAPPVTVLHRNARTPSGPPRSALLRPPIG